MLGKFIKLFAGVGMEGWFVEPGNGTLVLELAGGGGDKLTSRFLWLS